MTANDNEKPYMTPEQYRDLLQGECDSLPAKLRAEARLRFSLPKMSPEDAELVSAFVSAKIVDNLQEAPNTLPIDIIPSLDRTPIMELNGTIAGIDLMHSDPEANPGGHLQLVSKNGTRAPAGVTAEELAYLEKGWDTIRRAQESPNVLEQILGYALELALVTRYQQKQIDSRGRDR